MTSLLLVYSFVPYNYAIFIYSIFRALTTEGRKDRKTRVDQEDSSREDEDKVENRISI